MRLIEPGAQGIPYTVLQGGGFLGGRYLGNFMEA